MKFFDDMDTEDLLVLAVIAVLATFLLAVAAGGVI